MKAATLEITVSMTINVDGAYNAYGPSGKETLDFELNAHAGAKASGKIVGYLTESDGHTPIVQGPSDPCPGYYISTTSYSDRAISKVTDPRRYVNAAEINYVVRSAAANGAGVRLGDFCVVHSLRTRLTVFAIVGDSGNSKGSEGSLALIQRLGYPAKNGKSGGVDKQEVVVRYFAASNPNSRFFIHQAELENAARELDLDTDFSGHHPGDPGKLVLDAVAVTGSDPRVARALPFAPLAAGVVPLAYPGHLIRLDSPDAPAVTAVQQRLRDLGYVQPGPRGDVPLAVDGDYGINTLHAVELFQIRHTDLEGDPLEADGEVGSDTWGALFGRDSIHASPPPAAVTTLLGKVLEIAAGEVGVREVPPGSNRGTRVEQYQRRAGISPGDFWCVAFTYWCFDEAAKALGVPNPMIRTGGVLDHWNRAKAQGVPIITQEAALDDPSRVVPGTIFIYSTGGGHGHTGLVVRVIGNKLETIEGNTNDNGSSNGIGVFRRTGRSIASINRGFIHY